MNYPKKLGLNMSRPTMNIYELMRQEQQKIDEIRNKARVLQIEIIKKPKNFSEKLEFRVKTDLSNNERLYISLLDVDSIFSNLPDGKNDTRIQYLELSVDRAKKGFVINLSEDDQKRAFADIENDAVELYLRAYNDTAGHSYSEVFNVEKAEFKNKSAATIKRCFCDKEISSAELKNIIIELRKREIYIEKGRLIRDTKGIPILKNGKKQFTDITMFDELGEKLFNLDYPEKINPQDANFIKFANALNKTFKDYEINTCIRKIHFLAQCYHETQRFTITYEKNPNSNVSGGAFYRGRGLIQKKVMHYDECKNKK